jgi:type IV pilus assembly protein PilW
MKRLDTKGLTLVELLIAMALSGVVLGAISSTFLMQSRMHRVQEQVNEMTQSTRAAMDMMTREVRMAGYRTPGGIPYSASQLEIRARLTDDANIDDPNETIVYSYDSTNLKIDRTTVETGGTSPVTRPFAENITAFSFAYLTQTGAATTTASEIRQVRITITARTSRPDPDYSQNGGYRTYTLTSLVTPKNLAYSS